MFNDIHRSPDGSIDFDFYRAYAAAKRRQARRDALRTPAAARASIMTGALGFAVVIPQVMPDAPLQRFAALASFLR